MKTEQLNKLIDQDQAETCQHVPLKEFRLSKEESRAFWTQDAASRLDFLKNWTPAASWCYHRIVNQTRYLVRFSYQFV